MRQIKTVVPWAHKFATRSLLLTGTTVLAFLAFAPTVSAQVAISITPPVCAYGYYEYAPYGCAPHGFYGPGYFYGGVFLGVGPWAHWGYAHGWGEHRFSGGGGGRYVGGRAYAGNRGGGATVVHTNHASGVRANSSATRSHAAAAHGGASHAPAGHSGGSHGSGEAHGGEHHND